MLYTPLTKKAIKICYEKHKNQFDKSGLPYVFHPWHVAEQMDDENSTIVALLHDVVEDTNMTLDDLKKNGFNNEIIGALKCLTHEKGVAYSDYIKIISMNEVATKVKLADLEHNMDISRIDNISKSDIERLKKYEESHAFLQQITFENKKIK